MLDDKGEVQRRLLAAVVFADPEELKALEAMVHPWIKTRIRAEVDAARADALVRLIVLDAAVMLEAGWHDVCDRLVFIDAPRDARRRRVAEQRGWKAEDLEAREAAQLPLTAKAAHADHTIDNSASLEHLERQVDELVRRWGRADEPTPAARSLKDRFIPRYPAAGDRRAVHPQRHFGYPHGCRPRTKYPGRSTKMIPLFCTSSFVVRTCLAPLPAPAARVEGED